MIMWPFTTDADSKATAAKGEMENIMLEELFTFDFEKNVLVEYRLTRTGRVRRSKIGLKIEGTINLPQARRNQYKD
jgi:hypothetical protein